jgi:hypothetical protein
MITINVIKVNEVEYLTGKLGKKVTVGFSKTQGCFMALPRRLWCALILNQ